MREVTGAGDIKVRPFLAADQGPADALIRAGLAEHFGKLDPEMNPDLRDIQASYLDRGDLFLVGELDGRIVATGALRIEGGSGQIVRVSVAPERRREGVARRMVEALLQTARERRMTRVWMETNDNWDAAIALYRAAGFREFDRRDGCVFMSLRLSRDP